MLAQARVPARILTICETSAPIDVWRSALERARTEGVKVFLSAPGWYATSVSRPGTAHMVNGHCDCEAGQHGRVCKHLAAVRSAQYNFHALEECAYCGRVAPLAELTREDQWLGGLGYREQWWCAAGYGHQLAAQQVSGTCDEARRSWTRDSLSIDGADEHYRREHGLSSERQREPWF
jgi:hypothetical protein